MHRLQLQLLHPRCVCACCCSRCCRCRCSCRCTRTRRLRVQPLQPASVPRAFRLVHRRPAQECTWCLLLAGICLSVSLSGCLPACLPACLVLCRGTGLRKLSHRPASSLVLTSCNARGSQEPRHSQMQPSTGKVPWARISVYLGPCAR